MVELVSEMVMVLVLDTVVEDNVVVDVWEVLLLVEVVDVVVNVWVWVPVLVKVKVRVAVLVSEALVAVTLDTVVVLVVHKAELTSCSVWPASPSWCSSSFQPTSCAP